MKANLKGLTGIKGLFLKHCEKLGVLAVGVCTVLILYSTTSHGRLPADKQPERLEELIRRTRQHVEGFRWDDMPEEERAIAQPMPDNAQHTVVANAYKTDEVGWNRPVVPPTVLRTDPVLLTVQDLEAHGGAGLLAYVDENIQRQRELEAAREQEARERERAEAREQQLRDQERGRNQRGRGRDEFGRGGRNQPMDPDHPNRRRIMGGARPGGVPIQGDERVEISHWATIVAKVPVEDQLKLFHDALENARDYNPGADCPEYRGYYVQRVEVRRGQKPDWSNATTIFAGGDSKIDKIVEDWGPSQQEVIDGPYYDPLLTFPLPSLVGRDFSYDATHSEIPLAVDVVPDAELEDEEEPEEEGEETELFARPDGMDGRGGRGPRGGRGGYGMGMEMGGYGGMEMGGYGMEMGGYGGMEMGGYGMGMEMGGYGGMGMEGGMGGGYSMRGRQRGAIAGYCTADVPHLLFRFFDFSVEPGRRYKYRVRLVITDVNANVSKSSLENDVIERLAKQGAKPKTYRVTEWSEPSPTVSIPRTGSVRVVNAKPASTKAHNSEPQITLLVQSVDLDEKGKPIQGAKERELRRGHVANMTEEAEVLIEQNMIDKIDDFKFRTDITVLDIDGGRKLTSDLSEPARVLLMDPGGRIYVRDEVTDFDDVDLHAAIFAEDKDGRNRGGFEGGYEGYPGGYGGYGEGGAGFYEGF